MRKRFGLPGSSYVLITLLVVLMTLLLSWFGLAFDLVNIALIFLFPVLLSAVLWGLRPAFYAAVLGVLAFDFFFVPPTLSFSIADLRYVVSFCVYLSVAALTASLAARLKQQLLFSRQREARTAALYELSKQLSDIADLDSLLDGISRQVLRNVGTEIAIYLANDRRRLDLAYGSARSGGWGHGEAERTIAKWVFEHGEAAGSGTSTLRESPGYYVPLRTEDRVYGVMALLLNDGKNGVAPEDQRLLEAIAGLAASAITRIRLADEAKIAHLTAESERLRTAILDSVSHELRTPLAAIIGSATGLIEGDQLFTSEDRMELLLTIRDGALRMNRLVINLLSMAQLESGMLRLRKNWCDVEDLIGVALSQVRDFRQHRRLRVQLPEAVPMVSGDEVLLEQMLVNIVSNAIKYSPDYSEIVIGVQASDQELTLAVADQGTGLPEDEYARIFEKFYRSPAASRVTGTGLGLAICKGIAELHGGTISAKANVPRGTVVTVTLPLPRQSAPPILSHEGRIEEDDRE
ncbi:ATP-binding protein [Cohnella zeiphila]|uniref:histidine kinase n=1 Tax=Cohnella zeiphila TaxID=2761120 RepID=A0A7X0SPP3_9BACL|nr:ATP-binding protein [Cohnella zeiphila]MBB6733721.1 DUF4118 domain-containing protein [Cohnella zeiphila]